MKRVAVLDFGFGMRARKGKEFIWNDPVEIAIFYSLVILVFFNVKSREVDEVVLKSFFKSVEAIKQAEVVCADAE